MKNLANNSWMPISTESSNQKSKQIMDNQNNNRTIQQMSLNTQLLAILKSKDNHKLSRYDAFLWLIEHILEGCSHTDQKRSCFMQHYCSSITELSETWHWSRPTTQKFINELMGVGLLQKKRFGNSFAFSLTASAEALIQ